jgi:hypothetical protein
MGNSQSRRQQTTLEDFNSSSEEGSGSGNSGNDETSSDSVLYGIRTSTRSALSGWVQEANLSPQFSRVEIGFFLIIVLSAIYTISATYVVQQGYISIRKVSIILLEAEYSLLVAAASALFARYLSQKE